MTVTLSHEQRIRVRAKYIEHTTDPKYKPIIEEARQRGYRLAEPGEREYLDCADLYHWRGTLWVKLKEKVIA